jgi:prepilin-type N-terminal cleavage/methylation domain-containing protein
MGSKPASEHGADHGATLIELVMAVAILGIAFSALLGGMFTFTYAAASHSRQASGAEYIREYAEAVAGATYQSCATTYAPTGFTTPTGWTLGVPVVNYWNATTFVATCSSDLGLQRVHLSLSSNDGRDTETLDVVKRLP